MIDLDIRDFLRRSAWLVVFLAALGPQLASAQLQVDIRSGVTAPIPIAIEDFAGDPQSAGEVIRRDLARSGRFLIGARTGSDYLLTGSATLGADGRTLWNYELTNLLTGQRLLFERVGSPATAWRNAAHRISERTDRS